jgi:hypothetical protein
VYAYVLFQFSVWLVGRIRPLKRSGPRSYYGPHTVSHPPTKPAAPSPFVNVHLGLGTTATHYNHNLAPPVIKAFCLLACPAGILYKNKCGALAKGNIFEWRGQANVLWWVTSKFKMRGCKKCRIYCQLAKSARRQRLLIIFLDGEMNGHNFYTQEKCLEN